MTTNMSVYGMKFSGLNYITRNIAQGFKRISIWIPPSTEDDFKLMADICRDNKDLIPPTVRSLTTGKMKGIIPNGLIN